MQKAVAVQCLKHSETYLIICDAFRAGNLLGMYISLALVGIYVAQLSTPKAPNCTQGKF